MEENATDVTSSGVPGLVKELLRSINCRNIPRGTGYRHKAVFGQELGHVQGITARLHIDPQAMPHFCKARTMPYTLHVEQELQPLVTARIIKQVEFADWVASIVPVIKPDGSVRICRDYKTLTLYILQIEDLFAYQQFPLDDASKQSKTNKDGY